MCTEGQAHRIKISRSRSSVLSWGQILTWCVTGGDMGGFIMVYEDAKIDGAGQ